MSPDGCHSNGYDLGFDDSEAWANALVALIEHVSTEEDFIAAIRPFVVEC
jgi:hypothetical protein